MAQQNGKCSLNPGVFTEKCFLNGRKDSAVQGGKYYKILLFYGAYLFEVAET